MCKHRSERERREREKKEVERARAGLRESTMVGGAVKLEGLFVG